MCCLVTDPCFVAHMAWDGDTFPVTAGIATFALYDLWQIVRSGGRVAGSDNRIVKQPRNESPNLLEAGKRLCDLHQEVVGGINTKPLRITLPFLPFLP